MGDTGTVHNAISEPSYEDVLPRFGLLTIGGVLYRRAKAYDESKPTLHILEHVQEGGFKGSYEEPLQRARDDKQSLEDAIHEISVAVRTMRTVETLIITISPAGEIETNPPATIYNVQATFELKDVPFAQLTPPPAYGREGLTREFFRAYRNLSITGDNPLSDIERLVKNNTTLIRLYYAPDTTAQAELLPFFELDQQRKARVFFSEKRAGYLTFQKESMRETGGTRSTTEQFESEDVITLLKQLSPTKHQAYNVVINWKRAEETTSDKDGEEKETAGEYLGEAKLGDVGSRIPTMPVEGTGDIDVNELLKGNAINYAGRPPEGQQSLADDIGRAMG